MDHELDLLVGSIGEAGCEARVGAENFIYSVGKSVDAMNGAASVRVEPVDQVRLDRQALRGQFTANIGVSQGLAVFQDLKKTVAGEDVARSGFEDPGGTMNLGLEPFVDIIPEIEDLPCRVLRRLCIGSEEEIWDRE